MPWRENCSQYAVFVSEVMLQQTTVARVMEKYPPFIAAFPGFKPLAEASLSQVYPLWQGLGYNRRAKYLRDAAVQIMQRFGGNLPRTIEELSSLPGIGKNTAGAILAYAFNEPSVYIETNIRAVFIHHFFPGRTDVSDDEILPLVRQTCGRKNPRVWYWALMDYGTWLKKTQANPSRRGSAHKKQKPFKNSDRMIRGMIMKALADKGTMTEKELSALNVIYGERVLSQIEALAQEGLIRESEEIYRLGD